RLLDQMTVARRYVGEDEFAEALSVLQTARKEVIARIPHPKPGSDLQKRLAEIRGLEQTITDAERDHKRMMSVLQEVDDLLEVYAKEKSPDKLVSVRNRLHQLTEQEEKHYEARARRTRLIELQGVGESWQQGQEAYRLGEWARAIELLQRVAESEDAKEKDEALILIQRARAAEHVINARQEESRRNWRAALDKYGEAQRIFKQYDPDDQTEHLRQECTQALERLKPLEAHDQEVRRAIQQAQSWLAQAAKTVQARRTLLGKVEPIEQYKRAVDALLTVREQDTTLTDELEATLRDARNEWRQTYLAGMRQARHSKDENILGEAVQLGDGLNEQGLLYEADDKQTYQDVQERYLELQYEHLSSDPATDPAVTEENRRRRLEMATVKTDDLRSQYREAIEQRVLSQMSAERRDGGAAAAYTFLQPEILKPELYQSEKLLVEYMRLCWELEDWGEAQRQAESLEFRAHLANAKSKSEMWVGLTDAASLLNRGDLDASRAEIRQMEARIQGADPQLIATLYIEEQWLKEWRVDRLIAMAREAAAEEQDEKNIEAALLYAQAF
ncbi:MAG: hypothetical protein GY803_19070, partial [Chloroflexi bacterium]|nr:hypothetical protein [Chloroflexota bacterium]